MHNPTGVGGAFVLEGLPGTARPRRTCAGRRSCSKKESFVGWNNVSNACSSTHARWDTAVDSDLL